MNNRQYLMASELPARTPWGAADSGERYGEGIICINTPSHGGFLLDGIRNAQVHQAWRQTDGAYEEDSNWAIIAATFPSLFEKHETEVAEKSLRNWLPDQYMTVTGKTILTQDSMVLRARKAAHDNKDKYVTIAAEGRGDLVKLTATKGGVRNSLDKKTFMVPREKYQNVEGGFVIDETLYPEIQD